MSQKPSKIYREEKKTTQNNEDVVLAVLRNLYNFCLSSGVSTSGIYFMVDYSTGVGGIFLNEQKETVS
jgi:hypothetical protein